MSYCFTNCTNLTSLDGFIIPNSATNISSCFRGCTNLTSLNGFTIPNSVTNISSCFRDCTNLTSLNGFTIPNSVTNISSCFHSCANLTSLDNFVIPNSVTDMSYCFTNCTNLTSLDGFTIPNSVTNMSYCFYSCNKIESIIVLPSSVVNTSYCFFGITKALIVVVQNNPTVYNSMFSDAVISGPVSSSEITVVLIESANETTWDTIINSYNNRSVVKRRLFNNDLDVEIGDYHYSHSNGNFYATDVIDTTKTIYGPLLPMTTYMVQTFEDCSNLITSPKIPNSVTNMSGCFKNCTSLRGNIIINNLPTDGSTDIFINTINDIYIINNFPTSTTEQQRIADQAAAQWRSIASQYANVHYEADDKNGPNVSVTCTRTNENQQMDTFGTYVNLIINNIPNDTYLPILEEPLEGKTFPSSTISKTEFYIDDNDGALITIDNTGLTSINFNYDLSLSLASDDILNQHVLNIKVTDSYGKHTIYSATLLRAAAILDFLGYPPKDSLYLDNPGTGMAIGKFATRSGLDIEYPTTVGQGLTPAYREQYEPVDISTETFDSSGEYYQNNVLDEYELVENPNVTDFNNGEYYHFKGRVIDLYNPQLIVGQYNIMNPEAIFIVGNGTNENYPSNALEVYYNGTSFADASGIMRAMFNLMHPIGSYYETSLPTTPTSGHSFDDDNLTDEEIADCGISWFDPRVMWGGTWVLDSQGRVTVGAGTNDGTTYTVGTTGGSRNAIIPYHNHSASHSSQHTVPNHTHSIPAQNIQTYKAVDSSGSGTKDLLWHSTQGTSVTLSLPAHNTNSSGTCTTTGGGVTVNYTGKNANGTTPSADNTANANMPPYVVVYRWHRTV